jgi:hypothetical protein
MVKSLFDISWQVDEPTYRADPALSQSTLTKFERDGFSCIDKLGEKISTPALTFGSAVDSIITGGMDEFNSRFLVADIPTVEDSIKLLVTEAFNSYKDEYSHLSDIPVDALVAITEEYKYQSRWKPETRARVILEKGEELYNMMFLAEDKTILTTEQYEKIEACVNALRTSPATGHLFAEVSPFDQDFEKLYQLKFKCTHNDVDYRGMLDLTVIDHRNKIIHPYDLKTTGHPEHEFFKSFLKWGYQCQGRLYTRLIEENIKDDPYFKDFTVSTFKFIVVNKDTLNPLVWDFTDNHAIGDLCYGKKDDIILRDPYKVGEELHYYLTVKPKVPIGINEINNIKLWINKEL